MKRHSIRSFKNQRGIAWWVIVIIVVVVIVVAGAIAAGTSEPTPPTPGEPPAGCFPALTQCRLFIQNEVSCCGGQQIVGKRIGWCVGWWDALPCR